MNSESEISSLLNLAGHKKGWLISSELFLDPFQFVADLSVYSGLSNRSGVVRHAWEPADIDQTAIQSWGMIAFLALIALLYIGVMCSHITASMSGFVTEIIVPVMEVFRYIPASEERHAV
ncbi:hypothetical protein ABEV74_19850 [Paenibacillus cisolokensis]|uniref:hypothetical protein n=1 Tax=Paenibacillus cisolokensis TaxID=1658519 RepID=UPI003D267499